MSNIGFNVEEFVGATRDETDRCKELYSTT